MTQEAEIMLSQECEEWLTSLLSAEGTGVLYNYLPLSHSEFGRKICPYMVRIKGYYNLGCITDIVAEKKSKGIVGITWHCNRSDYLIEPVEWETRLNLSDQQTAVFLKLYFS